MPTDRDFKGIWIPKDVWLSQELKVMEKIFYVEIDSLDNEQGCYASNNYFAKFFDVSRQRCSQIINNLIDKGFLTAKYERGDGGKEVKKRILRVSNKFDRVSSKFDTGVKKTLQGCQINAKENNTINNKKNNTSIKFNEEYLKECLSYWTDRGLSKLDWETAILNLTEMGVSNMEDYDIKESIKNYAVVLHEKKYHYTYKWMFWTFLDRGFKKFLPQSTPFEAFKDLNHKEEVSEEDKLKRVREAMG